MSEGQLLAADAVVHTIAFGVAVSYGIRNRRHVAVALACLSPIALAGLAFYGPGERIDGFPTWPTLVGAYVAANALLAIGLAIVGYPRDNEASDDDFGPRRRRLVAGCLGGYLVLTSLWSTVSLIG